MGKDACVCVCVGGGRSNGHHRITPPHRHIRSTPLYPNNHHRRGHVRGTQLGELPEPLVLASVDDAHAERVQLDVPMHRVVEHLGLIAVDWLGHAAGESVCGAVDWLFKSNVNCELGSDALFLSSFSSYTRTRTPAPTLFRLHRHTIC